MTMTFDSLRYAQRLQQVGVSREQSEAHAELARDMLLSSLASVAERAETVSVRSDLQLLGRELGARLELFEQRMTARVGAMLVVFVTLVIAAQKLL